MTHSKLQKGIIVGIVTVIIFSSLPTVIGQGPITYSDGFEEHNVGEVPDGYSFPGSPIQDHLSVVDSPVRTGQRALKTDSDIFSGSIVLHDLPKRYLLDFHISLYRPSNEGPVGFQISDEPYSSGSQIGDSNIDVWIRRNGELVINSVSSGTVVTSGFTADEWIDISVTDINTSSNTFALEWNSTSTSGDASGLSMKNDMMSSGYNLLSLVSDDYPQSQSGQISYYDDIQITEEPVPDVSPSLELRFSRQMDPNTTQSYRVVRDSGYTLSDVTNQANVTSSNTSVIVVNNNTNELEASDNISVVTINATYNSLSTEKNVTVAPLIMEYIDILPPESWLAAAFGFGESQAFHGIGSSVQWLLLIIVIGSIIGNITRNAWAAIGIITIGVVFIWVLGKIDLGLMLGGVTTALMLGLSLLSVPQSGASQKP